MVFSQDPISVASICLESRFCEVRFTDDDHVAPYRVTVRQGRIRIVTVYRRQAYFFICNVPVLGCAGTQNGLTRSA
jgi:hypothetical protein